MVWWQQLVVSLVGGLVAGGFALVGIHVNSSRASDNARKNAERDDLRRLAAALVRDCDMKWVEDSGRTRSVMSMSLAESAKNWEFLGPLREEVLQRTERYLEVNDRSRLTVAEFRLLHPAVADSAHALWWSSQVDTSGAGSPAAALQRTNDDTARKAAEAAFITAVRGRLAELT